MNSGKMPYPWAAVKGGTIGDIVDRMYVRLAEMDIEREREESLRDPEHCNYAGRIFDKGQKLKRVKFFEQYAGKVEVIDDNRLRFNKGVIYPKSFKVKFDGNSKIYSYKWATMKAFMDGLPALK